MRYYISILIVVTCLYSSFTFAQVNDKHKQKLIEHIHWGEFKKAQREIKKVKDWTYTDSDKTFYPDEYAKFVLSSEYASIQPELQDSLYLYVLNSMLGKAYENYQRGYYKSASAYLNVLCHILAYTESGNLKMQYATLMSHTGLMYDMAEDYINAENYFTRALELFESSPSASQNPSYVTALMRLGRFYIHIGNFPEAEHHLLQAMQIFNSGDKIDSLKQAVLFSSLGRTYESMGDYTKAENAYKQAYYIRLRIKEENPTLFVASLNQLGRLYTKLENYTEAEHYYKEALAICDSIGETNMDAPTFGDWLESYVVILNSYGKSLLMQKNYVEAHHRFQVSVRLTDHLRYEATERSDYAQALAFLSKISCIIGEYQEAEEYYILSNAIYLKHIKQTFNPFLLP